MLRPQFGGVMSSGYRMERGPWTITDDYEKDRMGWVAEPMVRPLRERNEDNWCGMRRMFMAERRKLDAYHWGTVKKTGEHMWAGHPCVQTERYWHRKWKLGNNSYINRKCQPLREDHKATLATHRLRHAKPDWTHSQIDEHHKPDYPPIVHPPEMLLSIVMINYWE